MIKINTVNYLKNVKDRYYITSCGKVLSITEKGLRILKPTLDKNGYEKVQLSSNESISKCIAVHRLVALAFINIPKEYSEKLPLNKIQVNHKNEVKTDNYVQNLEWCDCTYNINYGERNNKGAEKHIIKIYKYDLNGNFIQEYNSLTQASLENDLLISSISACASYKIKSCGNYMWRYFKADRIEKNIHGLSIKVKSIDINGNETTYNSLSDASRITGIPQGNISHVLRGRRHKAGNLKWEYV